MKIYVSIPAATMSSRRDCASCCGEKRLQHDRREDKAVQYRSSTCGITPGWSSHTIVIITLLLAVWLLPTVISAASQNETGYTSSSWNSTRKDPLTQQKSDTPHNPRGHLPASRRGDYPLPADDSSLALPVAQNQQVRLQSGNTSKETRGKSAVSASTGPQQDDDMNKIVSIVVPFTCVILVAGAVCASYKLFHMYKCNTNGAGLTKCLSFCDRCMSTPHVFRLSEGKKDSNRVSSVSSDSGRLFRYSFNSISSFSSWVSATPLPLASNTQRHAGQSPTPQSTSLRHASSSSSQSGPTGQIPRSPSRSGISGQVPRSPSRSGISGQVPRSPSRSGISGQVPRSPSRRQGSISSVRQNSAVTLVSNPAPLRSKAGYQSPKNHETKPDSPGHAKRHSFQLSRHQTYTPGFPRALVHSQGSAQVPLKPHTVSGGISRRHNSVR